VIADLCPHVVEAFDVDNGAHYRRCQFEPGHAGEHRPTIHVHDDDGCGGCTACAEPERYDDHTCIEAPR